MHPSGTRYRYVVAPSEIPPAPLPKPVAELISLENRRSLNPYSALSVTSVTAPVTQETIPLGQRNSTLFRWACSLHGRHGMCRETIVGALLAENDRRCEAPLSSEEVEKIVTSALAYKPIPWMVDPHGFARDPRLSSNERHLLTTLATYADFDGECFPSVRRLRGDTAMNLNAVQRAIDGLAAAGRIEVRRGNRARPNHYRLLPIV